MTALFPAMHISAHHSLICSALLHLGYEGPPNNVLLTNSNRPSALRLSLCYPTCMLTLLLKPMLVITVLLGSFARIRALGYNL